MQDRNARVIQDAMLRDDSPYAAQRPCSPRLPVRFSKNEDKCDGVKCRLHKLERCRLQIRPLKAKCQPQVRHQQRVLTVWVMLSVHRLEISNTHVSVSHMA